jgi:hypothetical protein
MLRGPLYKDNYRPQLSGHETFPLRYGWLKKAFDAVRETESDENNRSVFSADDAIARFGVGKNMVASIRHWAIATGVIKEASGGTVTTSLGRCLFAEGGLDPYMEHPDTAWLIHWQLCGQPHKTTWFWAFNYFPAPSFERDMLVKSLEKLAKDREWRRSSTATIRNDVACFVRSYVSQLPTGKASHEDTLESPLTELGLIRPIGRRHGFRFVRGSKPSLGSGVFCYAVTRFWSDYFTARTLSFEALAHEPGSPGRVFLLDENDLMDRLSTLEGVSNGLYRWSETTGLKQLIRNHDLNGEEAIDFIEGDYVGS